MGQLSTFRESHFSGPICTMLPAYRSRGKGSRIEVPRLSVKTIVDSSHSDRREGIGMKSRSLKVFALIFSFLTVAGGMTAFPQTKRDEAWEILLVNVNEKATEKRVQSVRVLGLLIGDSRALELVQKAAADERPDVRAAAATALGQIHSRSSVPLLQNCCPIASRIISGKDEVTIDHSMFHAGRRQFARQLRLLTGADVLGLPV
jgi:hypothetical protein